MKLLLIFSLFYTFSFSSKSNTSEVIPNETFGSSTQANEQLSTKNKECVYYKETNVRNKELLDKCSCEKADNRLLHFTNCLIEACTAQCKKDIESAISQKQIYGCENTNNSLMSETENCPSLCDDPNYNYTFNANDNNTFQTAENFCAQENQQQIQEQLAKTCGKQLSSISANGPPGAQLICQAGDCNDYCNTMSAQAQNCETDVTTQKGYSQCKNTIEDAMNLPKDPNHLPGGFEWRKNKCEMGSPCEQKIAEVFSKATTECNNLKDKAILCCDEPLKCTDEETQKLLDSINKQGASSSGISENCRKVKEKFSDIGNIVQKMAAKCDTIISSCKEYCNAKITDTLSTFNKFCLMDLSTESSHDHNKHTCSKDLIDKYVEQYIELASIPAQCEAKQEKANQMAQSGEKVLKSALSAAKCEEQARGGQPPSNDTQANTGAGGTMKEPMASPPVPEDDLHSASLPGGTKGRAYEQGLENGVSDESGGGSTWSAKAAQSKQSPGQSAQNNNTASHALSSEKGSQNNKNANSKNIAENDPKNPKDMAENKSDEKSKDIENDGSKVSDKNIAENDPKNIDKKEHVSQSKEKKEASNKTKKKGFFSKLKALFSKDKERDVASNKDNPTKKDQKKEQKKEAAKKDKKNKKDGIGLRKFTKADAKKDQKKTPHWTQIKPRSAINAKTSKYGSPHDNIFKRVSTRITFMCRTDRILDCE